LKEKNITAMNVRQHIKDNENVRQYIKTINIKAINVRQYIKGSY